MKLMKRALSAVMAMALAVTFVACGSTGDSTSNSAGGSSTATGSAVEAIKEAGKIVMVTNAEFEPFEYKDGDEIIGIDAEIAAAIAEDLGVELEITDIAFDSCIPSVTQGRADFVAAGMTVTEDRLMNVDFTDTYFTAKQAVIVPVGSDIKTKEDLNGKKVGVQLGTTGDVYCTNEDGSSDVTFGSVERFPKGVDAVSALVAGKLDCVIIDNFPAQKLVANNEGAAEIADIEVTESEEYAIAVAKGSDLCDEINRILAKIQENGKFDEIVSKYVM